MTVSRYCCMFKSDQILTKKKRRVWQKNCSNPYRDLIRYFHDVWSLNTPFYITIDSKSFPGIPRGTYRINAGKQIYIMYITTAKESRWLISMACQLSTPRQVLWHACSRQRQHNKWVEERQKWNEKKNKKNRTVRCRENHRYVWHDDLSMFGYGPTIANGSVPHHQL